MNTSTDLAPATGEVEFRFHLDGSTDERGVERLAKALEFWAGLAIGQGGKPEWTALDALRSLTSLDAPTPPYAFVGLLDGILGWANGVQDAARVAEHNPPVSHAYIDHTTVTRTSRVGSTRPKLDTQVLTLSWDGSWTAGRGLSLTIEVRPGQWLYVKLTWDTGTGRPSRHLSGVDGLFD